MTSTIAPKDTQSAVPGARTNIQGWWRMIWRVAILLYVEQSVKKDNVFLADESDEHKASNVSSVVGILFLVAMLVGCGGWIFYAYRNPHTPSGQCFIRVWKYLFLLCTGSHNLGSPFYAVPPITVAMEIRRGALHSCLNPYVENPQTMRRGMLLL